MSQLGTDHLAASLLDDLDEKVQQLDIRDTVIEEASLDSNDSEALPQKSLDPYVEIEINPKLPAVEVKNEGKLSQLMKRAPLRKSPHAASGPSHEIEAQLAGGASPPNTISPDKLERTSSETDKELSRSLGSKTRLPNLPPKDPAEERKHLAQFQEMMVAAKQRELAKAAEAEKAREAKEDDMHRLTRLWSHDILPNWGRPGVAARAEKIVAKGIPSACRGQVWARCLDGQGKGGRPSALTPDTYAFLLQRAYHPPPPYLAMTQRNAKLIAHDAANVFPELGLFGPGEEVPGKSSEPGPYHASLLNVINAHASLAPTEPYENRAIGSLAGVLLLHMDEQDAFLTLQGLLSRPVHAAFALSTPQASSYLKAFNLAFSERLPRLFKHFQQAQLKSEMFFTSWIANLFTKHLSLEVCCYIWDLYLVAGEGGDASLFLVALIMLGWLEPHLYGRLDEALGYLGQNVPLTLDYLIARMPNDSNGSKPLASGKSSTAPSLEFSLPKSVLDALKEARLETNKNS